MTVKTTRTASGRTTPAARAAAAPAATARLLSGGNPQIPKGYGQPSIDAYIQAMPDWKREVGLRLDALVSKTVPKVLKAVKWNSPLYGMEQDHFFLSFHCFDKYIKVAFFRGASLQPPPPVSSRTASTRYLHVSPAEPLDEARFVAWVKQASRLPGQKM